MCLGHTLRSQLLVPAGTDVSASNVPALVLVIAYAVIQSMFQMPPPSQSFSDITRSQGVSSFSS